MITSTHTVVADSAQPDFSSPLLIDEPPLQVLPGLAIAIGINEAIVLQQLHYLLRHPQFGKQIAQHKWIFNTAEQWQSEYFPFWSVRTIKTIFTNLANMGVVVTCQPEGRISRRKYYRIDFGVMARISDRARAARSIVQGLPVPITKTTVKETKESKETANEFAADSLSFSAQWKPDERTKEQKLRAIKPSNNYPSERTFDAFIESEELDGIVEYRPDLYSTLCDHKWHQWKDDLGKWVRIRDWKAYVRALDEIVLRR